MGVVGQLCCPGVILFFGAVLLMQGTGGKKKIDKIQAKLVDNSFIEGDDVQEDSCSETGIVTCEMTQAEMFKNGSADQNGTDWSKSSTGGLSNDIYIFSVFALILSILEQSEESATTFKIEFNLSFARTNTPPDRSYSGLPGSVAKRVTSWAVFRYSANSRGMASGIERDLGCERGRCDRWREASADDCRAVRVDEAVAGQVDRVLHKWYSDVSIRDEVFFP